MNYLIEKVKQGHKHCAKGRDNGCPYFGGCRCGKNLSIETLSVIESLQTENKIIVQNNEELTKQRDAFAMKIDGQGWEIKRLTERLRKYEMTEEEKQAERKQKRREYMKQFRAIHKGEAYMYLKEWRKKNPEKWKEQQARHRERQRQKRLMEGNGNG